MPAPTAPTITLRQAGSPVASGATITAGMLTLSLGGSASASSPPSPGLTFVSDEYTDPPPTAGFTYASA